MSNNTTNYNLIKPDSSDFFNVSHQNGNMDIIDAALTPTADPSQVPTGLSGKMGQWVSWIANRIKAITGKTNWYDAPDTTLANAATHINNSSLHLSSISTTANTSSQSPSNGGTFTAVDSITTDGYGRVTAKNTKTVTLPSVLAVVITGLSTATNAMITASDSVLSALGKLQAQITANLSTLTSHTTSTSNPHSTTALQVGLGAFEATAANIKMNGTQSAGSLSTVARGDHVHPTDTSRAASGHTHAESEITSLTTDLAAKAPLVSPSFTGTPTAATAPSSNMGIARLMEVSVVSPWKLIQSYTTAGTYTFTATDVYGDGRSYEIGVYIVGGGGSGGAIVDSSATAIATGGASGYARCYKMTVAPNNTYSVVVGAGGASVSYSFIGSTGGINGNNGGSSSFNGITVSGGNGGKKFSGSYAYIDGSDGGQGSDMAPGSYYNGYAPAMGEIRYSNTNGYKMGSSRPVDCLNQFDLLRRLGAGGLAYNSYYQTCPTLEDGLKAGDGIASTGTSSITAGSATSPGSGGGGAVIQNCTVGNRTATSGKGADGGVFIYVRRYS